MLILTLSVSNVNCQDTNKGGFYKGGVNTNMPIESKYKEMGIPYRLEGVEPATKQQAAAARDIIFKGIKQRVAEDVRKKKQKQ